MHRLKLSFQSSTTSSTGQEYMFSADNPDSEFDNQNLSQNAQNLDNQSHSTSRTESVNQSEDDLCPDCEALDSGEPDTGEENSFISSHDKQGTIIRKGDSQQGTIIRKRDCRHASKERSIGHTRRKDLETRQLGFPYSVINCKFTIHLFLTQYLGFKPISVLAIQSKVNRSEIYWTIGIYKSDINLSFGTLH